MYEIPKVLQPVRIGGVLLKNRIVSAPTTMHSLSNGELYPTEDAISFFESRARSRCGHGHRGRPQGGQGRGR